MQESLLFWENDGKRSGGERALCFRAVSTIMERKKDRRSGGGTGPAGRT